MALGLGTDEKLSALVHSWKSFSSTNIISKEFFIEGIHLCQNISTVCYNNAILKLIQIFRTL